MAAITNTVVDWSERYGLSPAAFDVLLTVAMRPSVDREMLARARRIPPETIKSHARAACRRTGTKSLAYAAPLIRTRRSRGSRPGVTSCFGAGWTEQVC